MPGYYTRRPRSGAFARHGRPVITFFIALTGLALLLSAIGPRASASFTALPRDLASVPAPSLSQWTAAPGSEVTVNGGGFQPGSKVAIEVRPTATSKGTLRAGTAGKVSAVVAVPAGSRPGWEDIVLRGTAPGGQALVEEVALAVSP